MLHKLYQKEIQTYSIKQQLSKQKQTTTMFNLHPFPLIILIYIMTKFKFNTNQLL